MRIKEHPILGPMPERKIVRIQVNGRIIDALEGESVAAALIANGIKVFRLTKRLKEPRGVFCAIGRCTDCVMTVNGVPNVRTCVTQVEDGMVVESVERGSKQGYERI